MSRTPANFKQADVARAIRAARSCGLVVARVVVKGDGVFIETHEAVVDDKAVVEEKREIVL